MASSPPLTDTIDGFAAAVRCLIVPTFSFANGSVSVLADKTPDSICPDGSVRPQLNPCLAGEFSTLCGAARRMVPVFPDCSN